MFQTVYTVILSLFKQELNAILQKTDKIMKFFKAKD